MNFYPIVEQSIATAKGLIPQISSARQQILQEIVVYLKGQRLANKPAELVFICTHNSRRSHLGQVWAKVMADFYQIETVLTYSGGTESTACHPNTLRALSTQGLQIESASGSNPLHQLSYAESTTPIRCWSKKYSDAANPAAAYAAIMTCGSADRACPIVPGCAVRIPCTYVDPKVSDGTEAEAATYAERSLQIASEMAYVMQQVSRSL